MTRPAIEVVPTSSGTAKGRQFLERFKAILSYQVLKAYRAVERCPNRGRLGGHRDKCVCCGYETAISPSNSCRSRCCPRKCQAQARAQPSAPGTAAHDLLNTNYFHVVFTLAPRTEPAGAVLLPGHSSTCYSTPAPRPCSKSACRSPKRLGAEIGFLSILHTWSQNLLAHLPHVHCLVPAGGLSPGSSAPGSPPATRCSSCPFPYCTPWLPQEVSSARLRQLYRKNLLNPERSSR